VTNPSGLTGLTGFVIVQPEAPPEKLHGNPVNPAHGHWGEQAEPFPYHQVSWGLTTHGPYGPENQLLGESPEVYTFGAGHGSEDPAYDHTPYTHAAPWPKDPIGDMSVSPDNTARKLVESAAIHSTKTNATAKQQLAPTLEAHNDSWSDFYTYNPGTSLQPAGVPQSVGFAVGGYGSRDRVNSHALQNSYGFDSSHMHRRWATGSLPGNYMYLQPGSRPMVRNLPGGMRLPVGQDSPFTGDDPFMAFSQTGAILSMTPPDYVAPPLPATATPPMDFGGTQPGQEWW
jgi:hypothetical protein